MSSYANHRTWCANEGHAGHDGLYFKSQIDLALSWTTIATDSGGDIELLARLSTAPRSTDIPANASTTTDITIGGSVTSELDVSGDRDWVRVELVAGQTYQFSLDGSGASPLSDPKLDLRDSNGNLLASDDDGGPGLNSLLTFTATTSGTYYLDAHAFSTETGTYTLSASESSGGSSSSSTPLQSIDWGSQVSSSTVTVYFATAGETFDGETAGADWTAAEKAAAMAAFGVFADVSNLTFAETTNQSSATFTLVKATLDGSTLGYFNPPGTANAGVGVFNHTHSTWTDASLQPGGYAFVTLMHEFGHGLGMAHPHDDGGTSTVMNGVTAAQGSVGTSSLNQGVFTTMTYNDGWFTGPLGTSSTNNYGWQGTLGPLDIALIQQKYGTPTSSNSGNTTYALFATNSAGTMYQAIWDTDGTDTISYSGSATATIDLRAATLLDAVGGGGYVSYVTGVIGGFTIANGVVIENASGGSGNDTLTGNSGDNTLTGNGGNDTIDGGEGTDIAVFTGNQSDYSVVVNSDNSVTVTDLRAGSPDGTDTLTNIETLQFADSSSAPGGGSGGSTGGTPGETLNGDAGDNTLNGTANDDTLNGAGGDDRLSGNDGNDTINGGDGVDAIFGNDGDDTLNGDNGDDLLRGGLGDDKLYGGGGADRLLGDEGNDTIIGDSGNDNVQGGTGNDIINGGNGHDVLQGQAGNDVIRGNAHNDTIYGQDGDDTLYGDDGIDALSGGDGNDELHGGAGDDNLQGGNGADTFFGDDGNDRIYTGEGNDTASGGAGNDALFGANGDDIMSGDAGQDVLWGQFGNDTLNGGDDFDRLMGQEGDDTLNGDGGDDRLFGGSGNDVLNGGTGNDLLIGQSGNDRLVGGDGDDTMYGQFDDDTFVGGAGDDAFIGDTGTDTVEYSGNSDDYDIFETSPGRFTVVDLRPGSPDGTDTMVGIEVFQFADGSVQASDLTAKTDSKQASQKSASPAKQHDVFEQGLDPFVSLETLTDDDQMLFEPRPLDLTIGADAITAFDNALYGLPETGEQKPSDTVLPENVETAPVMPDEMWA